MFILSVVVPFFNGSQIWPGDYATIFSLVLLTCIMLPVIILFYRWLLPITIGRKRYGLFVLLLPVYFVFYEINARLASIIGINLTILPEKYRNNLSKAHPENFSVAYIHQTLEYTLLVLLAVTSIYMVRRAYKNQLQFYLLRNEKLRLELNQLKSQLQPHFFFNTLNNLYALSTQGSPQTSAMIVNLSNIMRYVLYECEHERVPLAKEVNFIKNYIELERRRHNHAIIESDLQGTPDNIEIEPLLFLTVIENAFKHSLATDIPVKYIKMVMSVDEEELIFQISNSCLENHSSRTLPETGGIGLKNLEKRLELLYPDRYQLDVDRQDGIFTVFLNIRFSGNK